MTWSIRTCVVLSRRVKSSEKQCFFGRNCAVLGSIFELKPTILGYVATQLATEAFEDSTYIYMIYEKDSWQKMRSVNVYKLLGGPYLYNVVII